MDLQILKTSTTLDNETLDEQYFLTPSEFDASEHGNEKLRKEGMIKSGLALAFTIGMFVPSPIQFLCSIGTGIMAAEALETAIKRKKLVKTAFERQGKKEIAAIESAIDAAVEEHKDSPVIEGGFNELEFYSELKSAAANNKVQVAEFNPHRHKSSAVGYLFKPWSK
ncbi:MAG: hypothetical protein CMP22_06020 [Rickettsiales bacterium]|nr:hypothetical protein [Rickettsiales bacterium]|tara:strand:- start:708 stop:1208 length:501 start_codon:yes stop_codon:yes gene_type:complete